MRNLWYQKRWNFVYFTQMGEVSGKVGEVATEWIEDDDDFRVVLRRQVDWNEGVSKSDGVVPRTTQQTTQQTTHETLKKSRDWNGGKSRDRNLHRIPEIKINGDELVDGEEEKSRDRKVAKSRDRRRGLTPQQTTQQTTQDFQEPTP